VKLQGREGMEDTMEEVKEEVGEVVPTLTVEERMEQGEAKNGVVEPEAAKVEVKVEPGGEEEEDPVIHEIPVFLSKGIDKLMLFQYPVRPASMPYEGLEVTAARVRPEHRQVELEVRVDTGSQNYSRSKGEQIALNVDGAVGARGEEGRTFASHLMDKQILVGSSAVSDTGRYAVGVLNDNELHLTRLESVLSLRPSLQYLDKSDTKAKADGRTADEKSEAEDVKPEAVTVRFARGDPERNKKYKEKSFEYKQKMEEEEPWLEADFTPMKGGSWDRESQRMFCPHDSMDSEAQEMGAGPGDFLLSLKGGAPS